MSKTIPQLNQAISLNLTDKFETSQSDNPASTSVFGTQQQLIMDIVNPHAQIDASQIISGSLAVARGGTNASSQTSNGINFFNGTNITSSSKLTFDGSSTVTLSNNLASMFNTLTNTLTGSFNEATYKAQRGDQANGYAQYGLYTGSTGKWFLGLRPGDDSLHFYDSTNNQDRLILNQSGQMALGGSNTLTNLLIQSSLSGVLNEARLKIDRGDATNGYADIEFSTAGTLDWQIVNNAGASANLNFFSAAASSNALILTTAGKVNVPSLTASSLVVSDALDNLISFGQGTSGQAIISSGSGSLPSWASIVNGLNGLTGALSITSTSGGISITPSGSTIDLNLTGSGASIAYSYITCLGINLGGIAFSNTTTYLRPFAGATSVSQNTNFVSYNDGASHVGLKYIGADSGVFHVTFTLLVRYTSGNTNTNPTGYVVAPALNGSTPINLSGPYSNSDLLFWIPGNANTDVNLVPVVLDFQLTMNTNDVVYPTIRSIAETNPALNFMTMRYFYATAEKIGDVGETDGVTSLNGLTGAIDLNAGNRIIVSNPSAGIIRVDYTGSRSGDVVATPGVDYNITNPCPAVVVLAPTTSGLKFILPIVISAGATNLLNLGDSLTILNESADNYAYLTDNGGTTLATLTPLTQTVVTLVDNSTTNGSWLVLTSPLNSAVNVGTTSVTLWPNVKYFLNAATLTTATLCPSAYINAGDFFYVLGVGSGLFNIAQDVSQKISIGNGASTTTGNTGYLQALQANSSITLFTTDGSNFYSFNAPQGNFLAH
jgi:hypothetical protein